MKILHLFPYLPTPPTFGGALRVYHILKHLAKHHDVTVAGFCEHGDRQKFDEAFPELEGKMRFINRRRSTFRRLLQVGSYFTTHSYWYNWAQSPKLERIVQNLADHGDFDFIIGEFATMGHFDIETDAIRILDAHNVEYDNFRRMSMLEGAPVRKLFYTREYNKTFAEEIQAFQRHDALFVTSSRDGNIIQQDVPELTQFVIPNGVDTDFFSSSGATQEPFTMVFTGAMGYLPNNDGMMYFLDKIFPLIKKRVPQAKVYIVGNNPPDKLLEHQSDSVVVTGFVDDIRPYIDQASVYIVPLRMGSGTRLKVVEALSMQKPIVSTSIGSEGIEIEDGKHLLIRDDAASFAEAVVALFEDQQLRNTLISNGHERVKQKYDWSVIGNDIEKAFFALTTNNGMETYEFANNGASKYASGTYPG